MRELNLESLESNPEITTTGYFPETFSPDEKVNFFMGLDVSSLYAGISILDPDGKILLSDYVDMSNLHTVAESVQSIKNRILSLIQATELLMVDPELVINWQVAIEESFQSFGVATTARTLSLLNQMNGAVQYMILDSIGVKPTLLNVTRARKLSGISQNKVNPLPVKEQALELFLENLPNRHINPAADAYLKTKTTEIPSVYLIPVRGKNKGLVVCAPHAYDMADSWIMARALYHLSTVSSVEETENTEAEVNYES